MIELRLKRGKENIAPDDYARGILYCTEDGTYTATLQMREITWVTQDTVNSTEWEDIPVIEE